MGCEIVLSKAEEDDYDYLYNLGSPLLSRRQLRKRHIRLIVISGEVHPEDLPDDPNARCGYLFLNTEVLFNLVGKKDPMTPACILHDSLYDRELNGGITRKKADHIFLLAMLTIAGSNKKLQSQAYLYYSIVRATGWLVW